MGVGVGVRVGRCEWSSLVGGWIGRWWRRGSGVGWGGVGGMGWSEGSEGRGGKRHFWMKRD